MPGTAFFLSAGFSASTAATPLGNGAPGLAPSTRLGVDDHPSAGGLVVGPPDAGRSRARPAPRPGDGPRDVPPAAWRPRRDDRRPQVRRRRAGAATRPGRAGGSCFPDPLPRSARRPSGFLRGFLRGVRAACGGSAPFVSTVPEGFTPLRTGHAGPHHGRHVFQARTFSPRPAPLRAASCPRGAGRGGQFFLRLQLLGRGHDAWAICPGYGWTESRRTPPSLSARVPSALGPQPSPKRMRLERSWR